MFISPENLQKWLKKLKTLPKWLWGLITLGLAGGIFFLIVDALSTPVSTPAEIPLNPGDPGSTAALFLSVFLKLGLVIVLMLVGFYLLRRWKGPQFSGQSKQMTVLETLRLTPRQTVYLVKVGDRNVMIGATDQSISYLTELEPVSEEQKSTQSFPKILNDTLNRVETSDKN
jgi:flagellar biosynthetic protein FliO